MNLQVLATLLLLIGLLDLALAAFLRRQLSHQEAPPSPAARWVITLTQGSGIVALLAGSALLLFA